MSDEGRPCLCRFAPSGLVLEQCKSHGEFFEDFERALTLLARVECVAKDAGKCEHCRERKELLDRYRAPPRESIC